MRAVWRALCALTVVMGVLLPAGAEGAYSARLRWRPSTDPSVVGYHVYVKQMGGTWGPAQDAGLPAVAPDGTMSLVRSGLDDAHDWAFAVAAYSAGGESPMSNEIDLVYAQVAPLIDSDGDGLTDAQEDVNLNHVVDPGETDPNNPDTDGDGVLDGQDACQGTAPGAAVNASGCSCAQITCDDGNVCNGVETCSAGVCHTGTAPSCDDGNPCTTDTCDPARGCVHINNTAPCADDGNACTTDVCAGGVCTHPTRADGTACDDGLFCTVGDTCQAGVCRGGGPNCTGYTTACRTGACDETLHQCYTTPRPDGTSCSDGNACNGVETCQAGTCVTSSAPNCDDGNPCTVDGCDPTGGCTHTPLADGASCANGVFCDGDETCQAGVCTPGLPRSCDDGNACTTDTCNESLKQCVHQSDGCGCQTDADCASSDPCTTNHRCSTGQCLSDPVVCPGTTVCTQATCDPALGCQVTNLPDLTACDDGNACTTGTVCLQGVCRVPNADPVDAPDTITLHVDKFVLRPRAQGLLMLARGSFDSPVAVEPDHTGVTVEIDGTGEEPLYTSTIPGNLFSANYVRTRFLYVAAPEDRSFANGLRRLKVVTGGPQRGVAAKGVVPRTVAGGAPEVATAGPSSPDGTPTLAWTVRLGDRCVTNPVTCGGNRARHCR